MVKQWSALKISAHFKFEDDTAQNGIMIHTNLTGARWGLLPSTVYTDTIWYHLIPIPTPSDTKTYILWSDSLIFSRVAASDWLSKPRLENLLAKAKAEKDDFRHMGVSSECLEILPWRCGCWEFDGKIWKICFVKCGCQLHAEREWNKVSICVITGLLLRCSWILRSAWGACLVAVGPNQFGHITVTAMR